MDFFFGKRVKGVLEKRGLSPQALAYRAFPNFVLDLVGTYLRVRTEGSFHVPKKGPAIVIANHSGFMAFDALMLGHEIYKHRKRVPRLIAHKLWFIRPEISLHVKKLGLVPATYENGLKYLKRGEILILFPEGEEGNFKPIRRRYKMRRFRRGFLRLALATGAPIIPATVVGAEETHITLSQIRWAKPLIGTLIPIPLNVIPFPAKWYLRYFKPIKIEKDPEKAQDMKYVDKLSRKIRNDLQERLNTQVKRRKRIFF